MTGAAPGSVRDAPATSSRFGRALIAVAVGALGLRVVYVLAAKRHDEVVGDALYYISQASVIANGDWFRDPFFRHVEAADHPPLTSLVMAPVAGLTDDSVLAMRLAMCVVGTLVVVIVGLLGRRVAGATVGLVAAVLAATYPNLWVNDGIVMSESLAALVVAGLFLVVLGSRAAPVRLAVAGGAVVGVATLVRAELALLLPLVVIPVLWRGRTRDVRLRTGAVAAVVALVVVSPWVAYNLSRFEEPVLVSNGDGLLLAGTSCDDSFAGRGIGFWSYDCATSVPMPEGIDQSEEARYQRDAAFDYIGDHLERLPIVAAARVGRLWGVYRITDMVDLAEREGRETWVSWLGVAAYWALLPLAVVGAVRVRRLRPELWWPFVAAPVVLVTVLAAATYGIVRFRMPAEIPLVVLAALGSVHAVGLVRSGRGEHQAGDLAEHPATGDVGTSIHEVDAIGAQHDVVPGDRASPVGTEPLA